MLTSTPPSSDMHSDVHSEYARHPPQPIAHPQDEPLSGSSLSDKQGKHQVAMHLPATFLFHLSFQHMLCECWDHHAL